MNRIRLLGLLSWLGLAATPFGWPIARRLLKDPHPYDSRQIMSVYAVGAGTAAVAALFLLGSAPESTSETFGASLLIANYMVTVIAATRAARNTPRQTGKSAAPSSKAEPAEAPAEAKGRTSRNPGNTHPIPEPPSIGTGLPCPSCDTPTHVSGPGAKQRQCQACDILWTQAGHEMWKAKGRGVATRFPGHKKLAWADWQSVAKTGAPRPPIPNGPTCPACSSTTFQKGKYLVQRDCPKCDITWNSTGKNTWRIKGPGASIQFPGRGELEWADFQSVGKNGRTRAEEGKRRLPEWAAGVVSGQLPAVGTAPNNVIIGSDERLLFASYAMLVETKSVRETSGNYGGASMRISKNVRLHGGGFSSTGESHLEWGASDLGNLVITDRRIIYAGDKRVDEFEVSRLVSFTVDGPTWTFGVRGRKRMLRTIVLGQVSTHLDETVIEIGSDEIGAQIIRLATAS